MTIFLVRKIFFKKISGKTGEVLLGSITNCQKKGSRIDVSG
jgi:hypothetical protein